MTEIQAEIIRAVLIKQFNLPYFHVGLIDDCLKVTNTIPDAGTYHKLNALHAVPYRNMTPFLRRWLFETCVDLFTCNGFKIDQLNQLQSPIRIDIDGEWAQKFIGVN